MSLNGLKLCGDRLMALGNGTMSCRFNHFKSMRSKRRRRRFTDETVPDLYRFQKIVDRKTYMNLEVYNNRVGDVNRKVRYYKAIFNRINDHAISGDMSYMKDDFRDKSRTDWF